MPVSSVNPDSIHVCISSAHARTNSLGHEICLFILFRKGVESSKPTLCCVFLYYPIGKSYDGPFLPFLSMRLGYRILGIESERGVGFLFHSGSLIPCPS